MNKSKRNEKIVTSLILKTTDIGTYSSFGMTFNSVEENSVGRLSRFRTEATFKDIDFKTLLGNSYNQYNTFAIELVQIQDVVNPNGGNQLKNKEFPENSILNLYLSGLNFINSTYKNQLNTTKAFLTSWTTREPQMSGGNFILNNDFEYSTIPTNTSFFTGSPTILPNWTIRGRIQNYSTLSIAMPNPSGSQFIALGLAGATPEYIRCSYYYDSAVQYRLTFWWIGGTGGGRGLMEVKLGTQTLMPLTNSPLNTAWEKVTIDFYPSVTGTQILEFKSSLSAPNSWSLVFVDLVTMSKLNDLNDIGEIGAMYSQTAYMKNNILFNKQPKADITLSFENMNGAITAETITSYEALKHKIYKFNIYGVD